MIACLFPIVMLLCFSYNFANLVMDIYHDGIYNCIDKMTDSSKNKNATNLSNLKHICDAKGSIVNTRVGRF